MLSATILLSTFRIKVNLVNAILTFLSVFVQKKKKKEKPKQS